MDNKITKEEKSLIESMPPAENNSMGSCCDEEGHKCLGEPGYLSRMISACKESLDDIDYRDLVIWEAQGLWYAGLLDFKSGAHGGSFIDEYPICVHKGNTPEEAVENLYFNIKK